MGAVVKHTADIVDGKYRIIADLGYVSTKKFTTGGINGMRAKRAAKISGKGASKTWTSAELNAQRVFVRRTEFTGNVGHM